MSQQFAAVAKGNVGGDDAEGADLGPFADFGLGVDDCARMDHCCRTEASIPTLGIGIIENIISAEQTSLPST